MPAKIVPVSEVNTSELFEVRQWTLGEQKGKWVVVDDDLILGIYEEKYRAEEHAASLNDPTSTTEQDLLNALEFANQSEED